MSGFAVLSGLLMLLQTLGPPVYAAGFKYPSPEEQIHRKLMAARVLVGRSELDRREELDNVARFRARAIGALPPDQRLGKSGPIKQVLEEKGVRYRRVVERLTLLKNTELVSGVMEKWQGQPTAWTTVTTSELHAVGYGISRVEDGWVVFVAVMVQDLVVRDSPEELKAMEQAVHDRINSIRNEYRLPALHFSEDLAIAARNHSRDMLNRDFFGHADPEGKRVAERVRDAGIAFYAIAENLTMNNNTDRPEEQAVEDWMDSPDHRRNILGRDFQETGIGIAVSEDGHYYFTQLFLTGL